MRYRVLIADGNVDAAESLALLLQLHGHETATAHTGPDALAAVVEFRPDAAFLALGLPVMDGREVCRRICAGDARPRVLVALTGSGSTQDRQNSLAAGFDHHLLKPADPDAILRLLECPPS